MTCSEYDWKGYVLGELSGPERQRHERHLAGCPPCRSETEILGATLSALDRLPQAEPPRRIAFVSDPVIELPWWKRFWQSGPQLGFASAAMLSLAILAHGFVSRPGVAVPTGTNPVAAVQPVDLDDKLRQSLDQRMPALLAESRAQNEAALQRIADLEKRLNDRRTQDLREVRESFGYLEKQFGMVYRNASQVGGD